jgi:hypothetical protein
MGADGGVTWTDIGAERREPSDEKPSCWRHGSES